MNLLQMAQLGRAGYQAGKWAGSKLGLITPNYGTPEAQGIAAADNMGLNSPGNMSMAQVPEASPVGISPLDEAPISAPADGSAALADAAGTSGAQAAATGAEAGSAAAETGAAGAAAEGGIGIAGGLASGLGAGFAGYGIGKAAGLDDTSSGIIGGATALLPLLLLADGGIAGYADGGVPDDDDSFSVPDGWSQPADGNATTAPDATVGGYANLFPKTGGGAAPVAAPSQTAASTGIAGSGSMKDVWTSLMAGGLGALASGSPNALRAIGQGGQSGIAMWQQQKRQEQERARTDWQQRYQLQQLATQQNNHQDQISTQNRQLDIQKQNADTYSQQANKPPTSDYQRKYDNWLSVHPGDAAGALTYANGDDPTDDGTDPTKTANNAINQLQRAQSALSAQRGRLNTSVDRFRVNNMRDPTAAEIATISQRLGIPDMESTVAALQTKAGMNRPVSAGNALPPPAGPLAGAKGPTPPSGAPAPGTIQQGFRFVGGNPSDSNNWIRVQ